MTELEAGARAQWAAEARQRKWTFWMRLSWKWPVGEQVASAQVAKWVAWLQARLPGAVVQMGLHTDTERVHAHALVFIPRRGGLPHGVAREGGAWSPKCASTWHQRHWPHGLIWLEPYDTGKAARVGGPGAYLARNVGTVWRFDARRPRRHGRGRR